MMSGHFRSRRSPARLSSELIGGAAVLALLAALLYATVLAAPAGARRQAPPTRRQLAAELLRRDPGKRLGGDTIVGVANGDLLLGSPNHVNFMAALGSGETLVGGNKGNEMGAFLGKNATIKGGKRGDLIDGGLGHDTLSGGAGNDLITDIKGTATIYTGSGRNDVEVAGHPGTRDRVLCAAGSVDHIYANRGDYIAPSCRKAAGSKVVYKRPALAAANTPRVSSAGNCTGLVVDCEFLVKEGNLIGFWDSDSIPAADCPASHPYLLNQAFDVLFTRGVRVNPPADSGTVITVGYYVEPSLKGFEPNSGYAIGIYNGSVTSWTFDHNEHWAVYLNCSSDKSHGWTR
jgi:RTX calcium-binding nonapeptide repeat (4 copies)